MTRITASGRTTESSTIDESSGRVRPVDTPPPLRQPRLHQGTKNSPEVVRTMSTPVDANLVSNTKLQPPRRVSSANAAIFTIRQPLERCHPVNVAATSADTETDRELAHRYTNNSSGNNRRRWPASNPIPDHERTGAQLTLRVQQLPITPDSVLSRQSEPCHQGYAGQPALNS